MNPEKAIDLLKQLFAACPGAPEWGEHGRFTVSAGTNGIPRTLLNALEAEDIFYSIPGDSARSDPVIGSGTRVTLDSANQVERLILGPEISSLLKVSKALRKEPRGYVIWHASQPVFHLAGHSTDTLPQPFRSYHSAIELWKLLEKFDHHTDQVTDSLWYFGLSKTEIPPGFTIEDLKHTIDVSKVVEFMAGTDAHEVRKEIFSSRVAHHLKDVEVSKRFQFLLSSLPRFERGLKEAMAIYLCEHSPEKLEQEAGKAAIDYTEKLEKIVSGLEAKSLTVPAAVWVAFKDINPQAGVVNLMILLTAVLYAAAMFWVWWTQSALLEILHKSMKDKSTDFKRKGLDENNEILNVTFTKLINRAHTSEIFAGVMAWCGAIPLIVGIAKWICAS